jgi:serine/threonine protein kinase/pSer/pThr/pTyr-binding forkhead associated (FHA) protein
MPILVEGQRFERYRVNRWLGSGVSGESYEVENLVLQQKATLKLIHPWATLAESARRQFFREMQSICRLRHTYLAGVVDYGEIDAQLYVARRYVSSGSLLGNEGRQWFRPPLPVAEAIQYGCQLAQTLEYIHQQGYIHGALTLGNILVLRGANVEHRVDYAPFLLVDVGLAHFIRRFGQPKISLLPLTAAPEQLGSRVTPASDQFALAVILYLWLAGRPPYLGSPEEIEHLKLTETIAPLSSFNPQVTLEQEAVLRRALSVYPEERYPSMKAFANALLATLTRPSQPLPAQALPSQLVTPTEPEPVNVLPSQVIVVTEPEPEAATPSPTTSAPLPALEVPAQDEPVSEQEAEPALVAEFAYDIGPVPTVEPAQEIDAGTAAATVAEVEPAFEIVREAEPVLVVEPVVSEETVIDQQIAYPAEPDITIEPAVTPVLAEPDITIEPVVTPVLLDDTTPDTDSEEPEVTAEPEPLPQPAPDIATPIPEPEHAPAPQPTPEPTPAPASPQIVPPEEPERVTEPLPQPAPDIATPIPEPEHAPEAVAPVEELAEVEAEETSLDQEVLVQEQGEQAVPTRLVIISPFTEATTEVVLEGDELTIGRAGSSDILLDYDDKTSRHHALLRREDGLYVLYDRQSANGVFVNGQKIPVDTDIGCPLSHGDHIHIGNYELRFFAGSASTKLQPSAT